MSNLDDLIRKAKEYLARKSELDAEIKSSALFLSKQQEKLSEIKEEQELVVKSLQAIKDVRPLLAVSAISKAEKLANSAIQTIFDFPAKLKYSEEDGRFLVETPDGEADLQEGSGGGLQAVVSFVFQVFLLMKEGGRLFIALDEAFTQLDDVALERFVEFLNRLCDDLRMDIILISHDARIQPEQVRHLYRIEEGKSIKIK